MASVKLLRVNIGEKDEKRLSDLTEWLEMDMSAVVRAAIRGAHEREAKRRAAEQRQRDVAGMSGTGA